jgi:hypothetical protein
MYKRSINPIHRIQKCRRLHAVHTTRRSLCRILNTRMWLSPLPTFVTQFTISSFNQIFIKMRGHNSSTYIFLMVYYCGITLTVFLQKNSEILTVPFKLQYIYSNHCFTNIMKKKSHCFRNVVLSASNVLNYNFACGSVWVRKLVSSIKEQTEGVWKQGAEENIWTEERWSDGILEKTA